MTETDWLTCTDPVAMLGFLRDAGKLTERKARLFAVACCRRVFHLFEDKLSSGKTLDFAERFADGLASKLEFRGHACGQPAEAWPVLLWGAADVATKASDYAAGLLARAVAAGDKQTAARWEVAFDAAWQAGGSPTGAMAAADAAVSDAPGWLASRSAARQQEKGAQVALLRCIFGPRPPPPVALDQARGVRNADTVRRLAEQAYQERALPSGTLDNARLAVLADALEEGGCDDAELLGHLRSEGPHVRGCAALDLLLGKE